MKDNEQKEKNIIKETGYMSEAMNKKAKEVLERKENKKK